MLAGEERVMSRQRVRMWDAVVWASAMLADAVVLKGVDGSVFVAALLVLIVGAAGTDALLVRALPLGSGSPPPGSDEVRG
jgi:hypothetical protein